MVLDLNRPLVFFDLETTGINTAKDRIVELCGIKLMPSGEQIEMTRRFNPGIPIPIGASKVHGIYDADIAFEPHLKDVAKEVHAFFSGCDLAGYNIIKFDLPLLAEELIRCGIDDPFPDAKLVDAMSIFHRMEPRNLEGALRFYCDEKLENAHTAKADVEATIKVLLGQVKRYEDMDSSVDGLQEIAMRGRELVDYAGYFIKDASGDIVFNFGKHKYKKVAEEKGYLRWMSEADFPLHTQRMARKLMDS